ncbi:MAG: dihydroorotate dehydrogenase [Pseudomonadota bacterium]
MTDEDRTLDAFFAAGREARPTPSTALLSRIVSDAAAQTPVPEAPPPVVRSRGAWLADTLRRGWQVGATATACMIAGLWIGYAQPGAVAELSGTLSTTETVEDVTFDALGTLLLEG